MNEVSWIHQPGLYKIKSDMYFILYLKASWLNRDSVLMLKESNPFKFDFTMVFISLPLVLINICIMHFLLQIGGKDGRVGRKM